jgi:SAM-dependent methyltransferase
VRKSAPFSDTFGLDRGLPVDREFIRRFISSMREDIRGSVMEMSRSTYSTAFGGARVTAITIVDIDRSNEHATLHCDLCEPRSLPAATFDCVILTQTLHLLPDLSAAITNLWNSLASGGVLLITVPALSRYDPVDHDYWRFTPAGLRRLLSTELPDIAGIEIESFGDAVAAAASMLGASVEDVGLRYLQQLDPAFPVVVAARVAKPQ